MLRRPMLTVAGLALVLTGCSGEGDAAPPPSTGASSAAPSSPASAGTAGPLAAFELRGGRCVGGECGLQFRVDRDGRYRLTWADGEDSGVLPAAGLEPIRQAVAGTELADAPPFTGTCPTDVDGTEVVVSWVADGQEHEAAGCEVQVTGDDPLVEALRNAIAAYTARPGAPG